MGNLTQAKQIAKSIGKSTNTIYRWHEAGKLPDPTIINKQKFWLIAEIVPALNSLGFVLSTSDIEEV